MFNSDSNSKAFNILLRLIVPNAPTTVGITTTFFICHNLAVSSFNKLHFSIFSCSLSYTLVSPGIATSIIIIFLYFISYHNIWSSAFYHVITLYGEIFVVFLTTLSDSCSYQSLALLNPSFSENCQCTYLPTLSCLCL